MMLQANSPKLLEKSECLCYTIVCIFILTRRLTANDGSGTIADSTALHSTAQQSYCQFIDRGSTFAASLVCQNKGTNRRILLFGKRECAFLLSAEMGGDGH